MPDIDHIVIHCSDSPQNRGDNAETIHRWHLERGWDGIGYHYVITERGVVQNGRPHYWPGAHVKKHNRNSLGICLIGEDSFTRNQMLSLRDLIDRLMSMYPDAHVCGHRDLDSGKTCPNFDVGEWIAGGMEAE